MMTTYRLISVVIFIALTAKQVNADFSAATQCSSTFNTAIANAGTESQKCDAVLAYDSCLSVALTDVDVSQRGVFTGQIAQWNTTLFSSGYVCSATGSVVASAPTIDTQAGDIRFNAPNDVRFNTKTGSFSFNGLASSIADSSTQVSAIESTLAEHSLNVTKARTAAADLSLQLAALAGSADGTTGGKSILGNAGDISTAMDSLAAVNVTLTDAVLGAESLARAAQSAADEANATAVARDGNAAMAASALSTRVNQLNTSTSSALDALQLTLDALSTDDIVESGTSDSLTSVLTAIRRSIDAKADQSVNGTAALSSEVSGGFRCLAQGGQVYNAVTGQCEAAGAVLNSCEGAEVTGFYSVDLDGEAGPLAAVTARCVVEDGNKWTEVMHNQPGRLALNATAGSYTFTYGWTAAHLDALRGRANMCRQSVSLECYYNLYTSNVSWVGADSVTYRTWGGPAAGQCACSAAGHCVKNQACNCAADAAQGYTDAGWLTNMAALPLASVNVLKGDTARGYLSIGALQCSTAPLPTSCEGLEGQVRIDPDGSGGAPAETVTCLQRDGRFWAVAHSNVPHRREVDGSEDPQTVKVPVAYPGHTLGFLSALADSSNFCRQYIRYDCFGTVLYLADGLLPTQANYGGWLDRSGSSQIYWGGATNRPGMCACGLTNSCSPRYDNKRTNGCNCDTNDAVWRADDGFLEDKSVLPVTQLHFGDLGGTTEIGYVTLGALECTMGSAPPQTLPNIPAGDLPHSCASIAASTAPARMEDGYYWISPDEGEPMKVYCQIGAQGVPMTMGAFEGAQPPLVYWDMETISGSNLEEMMGTGNTLAPSGSPRMNTQGIYGSAVQLPSTADYFVSVSAYDPQLSLAAPKSTSAWFMPLDNLGDGDLFTPVVSFGSTTNKANCNGISFGLGMSSLLEPGLIGCSMDIYGTASYAPLGQWRHVVITYDGTKGYIYQDGVLVNSQAMALAVEPGDYPYYVVGADSWWLTDEHHMHNGYVDEIKIYNYSLSAEQVAALYGLGRIKSPLPLPATAPGLTENYPARSCVDVKNVLGKQFRDGTYWITEEGITKEVGCMQTDVDMLTLAPFEIQIPPLHYWDMEHHFSATVLLDMMGSGNNMKRTGSPTSDQIGARGLCYTLTTTSQYWTSLSPFDATLLGNRPKSISTWVRTTQFSGDGDGTQPIFGFGSQSEGTGCSGSTAGISFNININQGKSCFIGCGRDVSAVDVLSGSWTHIAATYDGMITRLYTNGVQVGSITDSGSSVVRVQYANNYNNFVIGKDTWWRTTAHAFGAGSIDEVKVYNYGLSAEQILQLYNLDKGKV